ncbi:MAG: urease accessory protein UreF [Magnetovibrio sp.]|nr:urease accessory protein UreF [Magnetovibrio sp.]
MTTPIPITDSGLLRLMSWLSPSFPVGAYAYSHGAEFAVERGMIKDRKSAGAWIDFIIEFGTGRMDTDLFIAAYFAAENNNSKNFVEVCGLAKALKGTAELGLESRAQGEAFLHTVLTVWPDKNLQKFVHDCKDSAIEPSYTTAVAAAAAFANIGLHAALSAYLHAFAANIISAIVRLVPLGQTDGQKMIAALEPVIERVLKDAFERDLNDIGSAAINVDIMSMKHETQYSRLFRS